MAIIGKNVIENLTTAMYEDLRIIYREYRGHRISEKLINFANVYAKDTGFTRTYIPSEHIGLYEKYGYRYLKDIVNFGNGTDRLYVKELGR